MDAPLCAFCGHSEDEHDALAGGLLCRRSHGGNGETFTPRTLNGAQALMGFLCWLTTREEPVTFSRYHNAALAIELLDTFSAANPLGDLGPDWPHMVATPAPCPTTNAAQESFKDQLTRLLNHHSLEGSSDTPDFLLADYLVHCLAVFEVTIADREAWYGRPLRTRGAMPALSAERQPYDPATVPGDHDGR